MQWRHDDPSQRGNRNIDHQGRAYQMVHRSWLAHYLCGTGLVSLCDTSTPAVEWVWLLFICGVGHVTHRLAYLRSAIQLQHPGSYKRYCVLLLHPQHRSLYARCHHRDDLPKMLARYLTDRHLPGAISTTAKTYVVTLRSLPADDENTVLIAQAFSQSFRTLARILAGIGAVGWVLSFAVPRYILENSRR
jgi:hypothetical protein